jgi:hypothetical protein
MVLYPVRIFAFRRALQIPAPGRRYKMLIFILHRTVPRDIRQLMDVYVPQLGG